MRARIAGPEGTHDHGTLEDAAWSPPTSSWWALETPLIWPGAAQVGGQAGGCSGNGDCQIGEEIGPPPPSPVFSSTTRTDGKLSDKGEGMSEVEACHGAASHLVCLPTRALQIVVPIRWGTGSAAAPEPQEPARSDGEHRPRKETRVQKRLERVTLLEGR